MPAPKRTRSDPGSTTAAAREVHRASAAPAAEKQRREAIAATRATADRETITRQTAMAWWCPFCDHSQTTLLAECGGCGAVRDGDTARAA